MTRGLEKIEARPGDNEKTILTHGGAQHPRAGRCDAAGADVASSVLL
jgi:hypothetical protein